MKIDFCQSLCGLLRPAVIFAAIGTGIVVENGFAADAPSAVGRALSLKPTIVLVHGAFADASSWNGVVTRLLARGYPVIAAGLPLRGLRSDTDYLAALFQSIPGPIVAVGHSYGGLVITDAAAGNSRVKALVYVAAFAPEMGESGAGLTDLFPGSTLGSALAAPVALPGGGKDLYIVQDKYAAQFAADVPEADARLMAVAQRPIADAALHEPAQFASWRTIPAWFVFGSLDKNIPEAAHAFMAARANAREVVDIPGASHVLMISHPNEVAALIERAAQAAMAAAKPAPAPVPLSDEGRMPSLSGATGWLNSPPLTPVELRGKVVLVQFWTYSCINWLRTLPYVRAWVEKYHGQGLVVIGVHSPEFEFEKNIESVRWATKEMRIDYPIAVDSEHAIWRAFENNSWPALYLIDSQGRIRHQNDGEGDYARSERIIQKLLTEAGATGVSQELVAVEARGVEAPADWGDLRSPENYLGYERTNNFDSPGGAGWDQRRVYSAPAQLTLNHWALAGEWTMGAQAILLGQAGGRIACRLHARDLHLVMGVSASGTPVLFRVLIDGKPPGAAYGSDVDGQGSGIVAEPRLYHLVRQQQPIVDREFEIEFLGAGVEAFSLTFG